MAVTKILAGMHLLDTFAGKQVCIGDDVAYGRCFSSVDILYDVEENFNPKDFGTHSWRIGGATTMEAAQVLMEILQLQGRCLEIYSDADSLF